METAKKIERAATHPRMRDIVEERRLACPEAAGQARGACSPRRRLREARVIPSREDGEESPRGSDGHRACERNPSLRSERQTYFAFANKSNFNLTSFDSCMPRVCGTSMPKSLSLIANSVVA